ncbi:MAG TPA: aminoacyl-tRNA hydrolase, partial [Pirellulaceae bacterium]|nr:aminoacyl-tRNA hydrolase [Pirellulaceae bacterium]
VFFRLPLADLLIICDDFSLPFGRLRLRGQGTAGGQNGLKHILEVLGTNQFARLRVGIGPVPPQWDAADFVLSRFRPDEKSEWNRVLDQAADSVECWAREGLTVAMSRFNRAADSSVFNKDADHE